MSTNDNAAVHVPERRQHKRVENFQFKVKDHDFVPVWMFSTNTEKNTVLGLIIDLSAGGASLLVSKNMPVFLSKFHITILSPESSEVEELEVAAVQTWEDEDYSVDHKTVGIQFLEMDTELQTKLEHAIQWLTLQSKGFLRCEISLNDSAPS